MGAFQRSHPITALALLLRSMDAMAQADSSQDDLPLVHGDKCVISIATGRQQSLCRARADNRGYPCRHRGKGPANLSAGIHIMFNADVREPSLAPGLISKDLPMAQRALCPQASCKLQPRQRFAMPLPMLL
jgi:hypothetical protein